jgi:hypothetical protein
VKGGSAMFNIEISKAMPSPVLLECKLAESSDMYCSVNMDEVCPKGKRIAFVRSFPCVIAITTVVNFELKPD